MKVSHELQDADSNGTLEGRVDLRQLVTLTIDPKWSRDIDDALSVERRIWGYRLGVHVSDVAALV